MLTTALVGHTSMEQLESSLKIFKQTPKKGERTLLSPELLWEIDVVHMRNRLPIFSSTRVGKDWYGEGEIGERIP
jgi:hypothetical protein